MKTHLNKSQENKRQSVANNISHRQMCDMSTFQLVDNRPENIAQRNLEEMANNSPQSKQAVQLQSIIKHQAPIQFMTMAEYAQVIRWQQEHGLSISDYSYHSRRNLIVYYTQTGYDTRTIEVHVHLYPSGNGQVWAANIRFKGEGPPGIGLVGTSDGDKIVTECTTYWFPDMRGEPEQGADL